MKLISIVLLFVFLISLPMMSAAQETLPITISAGNYQLEITRVWSTTEVDELPPFRDLFLILETKIINNSDSSLHVYDSDFRIVIDGDEEDPAWMKEIRDVYYPGRDYPGGFSGQAVDAHSSVDSLLVYDIPANLTTVTIRFSPEDEETEFTVSLSGQPEQANNQPITTTTSSVLFTRQINGSGSSINVRSGSSTNDPVIGSLPDGSIVNVIGEQDGWYQIEFQTGTGWVFSELTIPTESESTATLDSGCDIIGYLTQAANDLEHYGNLMTETDPFNLTQLGATYYSLMDARYYYGELVVCDELQTVHTAMLNVLMGMSDTAATTFFAIANSDSASTYKTISENTIGPRFDEYLQILLDETERLTNQ